MKNLKSLLRSKSFPVTLLALLSVSQGCDMFFTNTSIKHETIPLIEEGDTLIYESFFETDSFLVTETRFYNRGEGEFGFIDYDRFSASMESLNCLDSCLNIGPYITPSEYRVFVYGPGEYDGWNYVLYDADKNYAGLESKLWGYQLEDLYLGHSMQVDSISGKEIKQFYYSRDYTVVEYELTNGQIFTLSEESLEMLMARE